MTKPIIRIHNLETNEIIDREMNDEELAQYEIDKANIITKAQVEIEITEKRAAAQAKLAAFGLTADDLQALGL